jgi:excisionase family DNA binding protein
LRKAAQLEKPPDEIMTIEEAAAYLRIPVSSMYRLAQTGKIPAVKVGRHWRFHRQTLASWFTGQAVSSVATPAEKTIDQGE